MDRRLQFHDILRGALGSSHVYFQPPASVTMKYPCIVYAWTSADTKFANNGLYATKRRYQVTVIDQNPDTAIPDRVMRIPFCSLSKSYTADNLNHYSFDIYY